MTDEKSYFYLVLGGEDHGSVFEGRYEREVKVRRKTRKLAPLVAAHLPGRIVEPEYTFYPVVERITINGKNYLIASNEDLSQYDIEDELVKAKLIESK